MRTSLSSLALGLGALFVPSAAQAYTDQQDGLLVFCKAETAVKVGYVYERTVYFTPVFKLKSSTYDLDMNWNRVKAYEESAGQVSLTGSYSSNGIEGQFEEDDALATYFPGQRWQSHGCGLSTSIENIRKYRRSQEHPVDTWRPKPKYQTEFVEVVDFPDALP